MKTKLLSLLFAAGIALSMAPANAEVGYIDYQRVLESYPAAKQAVKELDAKGLELQQYMLEKEKQYKNLATPLQKQNFESQTANEIKSKQEALYKLQQDKELQILNQVKTAARAVMVAQKLDAVVSNEVVFVGGIDITDQVIQKLK